MSDQIWQPLKVNGDRLVQRLNELGQVGGLLGGGCNRLALTEADRAGRDLVVSWMKELGLDVTIDAVGNVVAQRPGTEAGPPVMMGSHIDTVATGGLYDGNLGVLAGLEVVETLLQAGFTTRRPLSVGFFTNEEGSRFAPDMLGSLAYIGAMTTEAAHDVIAVDGVRLGDALADIGYLGPQLCPATAPYAFVELHIEQGPVLEAEGFRAGAVTGVQGISWQEVTISGQSNHAGTTPLALRHDAGLAAAEVATFVRRLARKIGPPQVGTVGRIELYPNLINVVAGRAVLTVDLRHTDEAALQDAERQLTAFLLELAEAEGVAISTRSLARFEPVPFDQRIIDLVERTAVGLGLATRRLSSGAGHDAQMLARVCPTGMIFVPSVKGVSHNPAEYTDPVDLVEGANVLLQVVLQLAEED